MNFKTAHIIEEKERTRDIEIDENVTFDEMYLSEPVLAGLLACGFIRPSPIQLSSIPLGRCGLDLIIQAKSGTGKTCVFSVIALEMISTMARSTQALVIAPTREIAVQICQVINSIGSSLPNLKASTFIGGTDVSDDKTKLRCCHIAIGTPGRLNQMVTEGYLNLKNVRLLVLDEADHLLTGQFKEAIQDLIYALPLNKQVLALSATYPAVVTEFLDKFMRSPSHIRLGKESPALIGVHQFVRLISDHPQSHQRHKAKLNELLYILSSVPFNQCLVFSNSQLRAESICNQLKSSGWPASYLTGGQVQTERLEAFFALCSYKCRILVSTDLSARGLDSEHVNLVINLDVPFEPATYLHRIGRAGRFGSKGSAISIVCKGEEWEGLQAIAAITNIQINILPSDYDSETFNKESELKVVEHLSDRGCRLWLEKQSQHRSKGRSKLAETLVNCSEKQESSVKSLKMEKLPVLYDNCKNNVNNSIDAKISNDKIKEINDKEEDRIIKPKQLLAHAAEFHPNIFSFEDMLTSVCEKWGSVTKQDKPTLIKHSLMKDSLSESELASLELYISKIDEKADKATKSIAKENAVDSIQALQNIIHGLHCQDNTLPDSESLNNINEARSKLQEGFKTQSAVLISEDGERQENDPIDAVPTELNQCDNLKNTTAIEINHNGNATASHLDEEQHSINNGNVTASHLDEEQHSECSKSKEEVIAKKKKEYAKNTGYGEWVNIEPTIDVVEVANDYSQDCFNSIDECLYWPTSKPIIAKHHDKEGKTKRKSKQNKSVNHSCCSDKSSEQEYYSPSAMNISHNELYNWQQYAYLTNSYIKSAQKFGMMMEYVRTVGKMSSRIAYDQNQEYLEGLKQFQFPQ